MFFNMPSFEGIRRNSLQVQQESCNIVGVRRTLPNTSCSHIKNAHMEKLGGGGFGGGNNYIFQFADIASHKEKNDRKLSYERTNQLIFWIGPTIAAAIPMDLRCLVY